MTLTHKEDSEEVLKLSKKICNLMKEIDPSPHITILGLAEIFIATCKALRVDDNHFREILNDILAEYISFDLDILEK
jgi:hypothetical protein